MTTEKEQRGKLIAFEGGEGAGKTTQAERLTRRLNEEGIRTIMVREPGGTALGNHIRGYVKGRRPMEIKAEMLLFAAARAQSIKEQVLPALTSGINVISDRYAASTVAYQGYGRSHGRLEDIEMIHTVNAYVTEGLTPAIYVLLDADPAEGLRRAGKPQLAMALEQMEEEEGRRDEHTERRFEDLPMAFHRRVRKGYLEMAKNSPIWRVIDANGNTEEIERQVLKAVLQATGLSG